jgi:hypothetical protein
MHCSMKQVSADLRKRQLWQRVQWGHVTVFVRGIHIFGPMIWVPCDQQLRGMHLEHVE